MWKIFLHNMWTNGKAFGFIYVFTGTFSFSFVSFSKQKYGVGILFLVFYFVLILLSVCLPQVPKALFLAPLSKKQRMNYVAKFFWVRIVAADVIYSATVLIMFLVGLINITNLILILCLSFIINLLVGLMDYIMSYNESDVQKFGCMVISFLGMILFFVSASIENGDSVLWSYWIMAFTFFIGLYVISSYRKFYKRMLNSYSDYEIFENRPTAYEKRGLYK